MKVNLANPKEEMMRPKQLQKCMCLGIFMSISTLIVTLLMLTHSNDIQSSFPFSFLSREHLVIPTPDPNFIQLQPNKFNSCPSILNAPEKYIFFEELTKNRTKHAINYYYAKHEKDGEISETVVVLTPISNDVDNARKFLPRFIKNLCSLTYPHNLISVVFGVDTGDTRAYGLAQDALHMLEPYFRRVQLINLHEIMIDRPHYHRHDQQYQVTRRKHLAKSRNKLMHGGLWDEKWALWLDYDLRYFPSDMLQQLLAVKKHVVVPSCVYIKKSGEIDVYDRNTWKETNKSRHYLSEKPSDFVMLEGYMDTMRQYLLSFRETGEMYVDIDGVGGAALLIHAECHRQGLIFPPFVYKNHLETEGLAKMARNMGFEIVGLPFLEVFHA